MAREEAWEQVGPAFRGEDRPILFVFGAARSGTTILNNLLYRHFSYGMGPEGTFVAEWAKRLPRYGDLGADANLRRLVTEIAECRMMHIVRRSEELRGGKECVSPFRPPW